MRCPHGRPLLYSLGDFHRSFLWRWPAVFGAPHSVSAVGTYCGASAHPLSGMVDGCFTNINDYDYCNYWIQVGSAQSIDGLEGDFVFATFLDGAVDLPGLRVNFQPGRQVGDTEGHGPVAGGRPGHSAGVAAGQGHVAATVVAGPDRRGARRCRAGRPTRPAAASPPTAPSSPRSAAPCWNSSLAIRSKGSTTMPTLSRCADSRARDTPKFR